MGSERMGPSTRIVLGTIGISVIVALVFLLVLAT